MSARKATLNEVVAATVAAAVVIVEKLFTQVLIYLIDDKPLRCPRWVASKVEYGFTVPSGKRFGFRI